MAGKTKTTTPSVQYGKDAQPSQPTPAPVQPKAPPPRPTGKGPSKPSTSN